MTILLVVIGLVVLVVGVAAYFIVKRNDREREETIERAIAGGCPFFSNNNNI